jgi:hypothetical protein
MASETVPTTIAQVLGIHVTPETPESPEEKEIPASTPGPESPGIPELRRMFKRDSSSYFYAAYDQTTIAPSSWEDLSEAGLKALHSAQARVKKMDPQMVLSDAHIGVRMTGFWEANVDHPHFQAHMDKSDGVRVNLKTWNDHYLDGFSGGQNYRTSSLVFYSLKEQWAITASGSFYRFLLKETSEETAEAS